MTNARLVLWLAVVGYPLMIVGNLLAWAKFGGWYSAAAALTMAPVGAWTIHRLWRYTHQPREDPGQG